MAHTASRYSATGDDRVPSFVSVIPSMSDDSRRRLMMGRRQVGQGQFFYSFDLDKVVPPDHLVRQIDTVLDLSWVHKELAPHYSHTGRPSIDPVLMIRMLIVGYVFAIRSERQLCSEVQVNLAYRWFCKLGIEDEIPDHSVFSRARHERFRESDALRRVFEGVVAKCIAAGLVGGEALSVDASLIKADVDKKKRMPGDQPITWPKPEEDYMLCDYRMFILLYARKSRIDHLCETLS
jgi:transposase